MGTKAGIKKIIKSFVRCLSKKFKQNENAEHYGEIKVFRCFDSARRSRREKKGRGRDEEPPPKRAEHKAKISYSDCERQTK